MTIITSHSKEDGCFGFAGLAGASDIEKVTMVDTETGARGTGYGRTENEARIKAEIDLVRNSANNNND